MTCKYTGYKCLEPDCIGCNHCRMFLTRNGRQMTQYEKEHMCMN